VEGAIWHAAEAGCKFLPLSLQRFVLEKASHYTRNLNTLVSPCCEEVQDSRWNSKAERDPGSHSCSSHPSPGWAPDVWLTSASRTPTQFSFQIIRVPLIIWVYKDEERISPLNWATPTNCEGQCALALDLWVFSSEWQNWCSLQSSNPYQFQTPSNPEVLGLGLQNVNTLQPITTP
jgi:hypothetical protein